MKLIKNKTIIGLIAIIVGLLFCFMLSPLYIKATSEKTKVVVMTAKVIKGQIISDDDIKLVEVGSYNLSENVLKKKDEVSGKYAATDLYPDEFVLISKLSVTPYANNEYLNNLDGRNGAISITLPSFAAGLSGKLLSGDIVSIISTDMSIGETTIAPELKYVKVLACTTASGVDVDDKTMGKEKENTEDKIAATVTLLVNEQQVKILANLDATQRLHAELIYRGDIDISNDYLKQQDEILKQLAINDAAAIEVDQENPTGGISDVTEVGGGHE
jgi:pilus assembly protein CpaB